MPQAFSDTYLNVYLSIYILYFYCKHHASLCDVLSAHNVRHPDTCRRTRYHTLEPTLTQRLGSPTAHAPPTPLSGYSNLDGQAHSGSDTDVKLEPALSAYYPIV